MKAAAAVTVSPVVPNVAQYGPGPSGTQWHGATVALRLALAVAAGAFKFLLTFIEQAPTRSQAASASAPAGPGQPEVPLAVLSASLSEPERPRPPSQPASEAAPCQLECWPVPLAAWAAPASQAGTVAAVQPA